MPGDDRSCADTQLQVVPCTTPQVNQKEAQEERKEEKKEEEKEEKSENDAPDGQN